MSGSVLDAILMEKRGIPTACIGVEKLALTSGQAMAAAHGARDYRIATVDFALGSISRTESEDDLRKLAVEAIPKVEAILLGREAAKS